MKSSTNNRYWIGAWLIVIGFALFRWFFSGLFLLVPDETNYWQWGRYLAWGYHDNAPMIGWTIRLATEIFGQTERAVRLPSVVAMAVTSAYLIALARKCFGDRAAFYTALLTQGILEFNVGGLLATCDGLQAAGWAGAAYHGAKAYETDGSRQWALTGFWFGFGLLSKFSMVLFLPGIFMFGVLSSDFRGRLWGWRPWAGLCLGWAMFVPVIYWNAANHWNAVRHVAYLGGADEGLSLHWKYLGEYLGSQAGLLSPLVFILMAAAWWTAVKRYHEHWHYGYLFWTSFFMVAAFAGLSLHTRVYGNWSGAGYLTVSVLTAGLYSLTDPGKATDSAGGRFGKRLWPWGIATSYVLTGLLLLHVAVPVLPISKRLDRVAREVTGWEELGRKTAQMVNQMPDPRRTFIFGIRYQIASELAFYTPGQPQTVSINKWRRPNVYDYWWKDKDLLGWDAVGVTFNPGDRTRLKEVFQRVDPPVEIRVYRDSIFSSKNAPREPANVFYIYRAYGFKGGLRWVPPNPFDIRASGP